MNALPYRVPVDDIVFVLTQVLRIQERDDLPGFEGLDVPGLRVLVTEAARFHEEVLLPLSLSGDREGAHFQDGSVITPHGFPQAWRQYRESGWPFVSVPAELGGGGLPPVMAAIISEMRISCAHSFAMYGAFCYAAATMIGELGAPWMATGIAPRIAAGDWTATMCLTESHAGSDLRQIQTRAVAQNDGTWRLYGEKIFISGGDHDLTDNIVHIVLAKIPDAHGRVTDELDTIGVFVVTKVLIDPASGSLMAPNALRATSIEHKMGVEGSATCTLAFDGAVGWQITDSRASGLAHSMGPMFYLMNKARVSTAMSGVAYAEASYQVARNYARTRTSGRAPQGARHPESAADPIVVQPDIRRLLLSARAFAEGARALGLHMAVLQSEAESLGDAQAQAIVELMTPVMKAYFTDRGFEAATNCLQVLGGHGYIRDYGIEQLLRNARVGQIYEGANGIQARDLMRMITRRPNAAEAFFTAIQTSVTRARQMDIEAPADGVEVALLALSKATGELASYDEGSRAAVAYDLLTAYGILAIAWTWLEILLLDETIEIKGVLESKRVLARFWFERELPMLDMHVTRVMSGGATLNELPDDLV